MPLTWQAAAALDVVPEVGTRMRASPLRYLSTDAAFVRPEPPAELVAAQDAAFAPVLAHVEHAADALATAIVVRGEFCADQLPPPMAWVTERVARMVAWSLAVVDLPASCAMSAILAVAPADGALTPEEALRAARSKEAWQARVWGVVEGGHDLDEAGADVNLRSADAMFRFVDLYCAAFDAATIADDVGTPADENNAPSSSSPTPPSRAASCSALIVTGTSLSLTGTILPRSVTRAVWRDTMANARPFVTVDRVGTQHALLLFDGMGAVDENYERVEIREKTLRMQIGHAFVSVCVHSAMPLTPASPPATGADPQPDPRPSPNSDPEPVSPPPCHRLSSADATANPPPRAISSRSCTHAFSEQAHFIATSDVAIDSIDHRRVRCCAALVAPHLVTASQRVASIPVRYLRHAQHRSPLDSSAYFVPYFAASMAARRCSRHRTTGYGQTFPFIASDHIRRLDAASL